MDMGLTSTTTAKRKDKSRQLCSSFFCFFVYSFATHRTHRRRGSSLHL